MLFLSVVPVAAGADCEVGTTCLWRDVTLITVGDDFLIANLRTLLSSPTAALPSCAYGINIFPL